MFEFLKNTLDLAATFITNINIPTPYAILPAVKLTLLSDVLMNYMGSTRCLPSSLLSVSSYLSLIGFTLCEKREFLIVPALQFGLCVSNLMYKLATNKRNTLLALDRFITNDLMYYVNISLYFDLLGMFHNYLMFPYLIFQYLSLCSNVFLLYKVLCGI
jgi:hypothetical protein